MDEMEEQDGNPCEYVKWSCQKIMEQATHVKIDDSKLQLFAGELKNIGTDKLFEGWGITHFPPQSTSVETLLRYIFVVDTLNFCFWPNPPFEYDNLAGNLYTQLKADPGFFSPERLQSITPTQLKEAVFKTDFCLLEERARMLREVFTCILGKYKGSCVQFVEAAEHSAPRLVKLVADSFPCFRDHTIYRGRQVFFYKRAQILVSDIHLAYQDIKRVLNSTDLGQYEPINFGKSIGHLTMFADYRVPQLLRAKNVLIYSSELASLIDQQKEVPYSSPYENEIRAATIVVVERLRDLLASLGKPALAIEVDACLWQLGEKLRNEILPPHHTLSIFY